MIAYKDFVLSEENRKTYSKVVENKLTLGHYHMNEVFAGHFNPVFEAIWIIAKEHFTKKQKQEKIEQQK
jgi:hypothetical protein